MLYIMMEPEGRGGLGLQVLLRRPAQGVAEVGAEPGAAVYAEAVAQEVEPAVHRELGGHGDVVQGEAAGAGLQQRREVGQVAAAYPAVHRYALQEEHVRRAAGGDVGGQAGECVFRRQPAAVAVVEHLQVIAGAAVVEALVQAVEAAAEGGDGEGHPPAQLIGGGGSSRAGPEASSSRRRSPERGTRLRRPVTLRRHSSQEQQRRGQPAAVQAVEPSSSAQMRGNSPLPPNTRTPGVSRVSACSKFPPEKRLTSAPE